ncbi:MAG: hypothetical protein QM493_01780 [Sulfurovum sp.]
MKKILIMMIASASLLLADGNVTKTTEVTTPEVAVKVSETAPVVVATVVKAVETTSVAVKKPCKCKTKAIVVDTPKAKCKCTTGTKCECKGGCKCKGMKKHHKNHNHVKGMHRGMNKGKHGKRKHSSSLLIKRGLTPLLKVVMMSSKDRLLGLDVEQFKELVTIKNDMMPRSKSLKKDIRTKKRAIQLAITSGTTVEAIKADMEELALLRTDATLLRIECINRTKAVLTKDQLIYLLGKSIRKNSKQKKRCNSKRCYKKR